MSQKCGAAAAAVVAVVAAAVGGIQEKRAAWQKDVGSEVGGPTRSRRSRRQTAAVAAARIAAAEGIADTVATAGLRTLEAGIAGDSPAAAAAAAAAAVVVVAGHRIECTSNWGLGYSWDLFRDS